MNKVLVFVVSFNRQPYLKEVLEGLFNNTNCPFDLIIHDNVSAQPTLDLLKNFEDSLWSNGSTSRVIYNKENRGTTDIYAEIKDYIKAGQHFLITSNDAVVPTNKDWLDNLITLLEDKTYKLAALAYPYDTLPAKAVADYLPNKDCKQYMTKFGMIAETVANISPISLYSYEFINSLNFKKLNKNNFDYDPKNNHEEIQIINHCITNNYKMGYLYVSDASNSPRFLPGVFPSSPTLNVNIELTLYNQWKEDMRKRGSYFPFQIEPFACESSPLKINMTKIKK